MAIKQRRKIANYLNVGTETEEYVLMGAGFTDLNEAPAAQTASKKYVNDKSATKSIVGYDWSTAFTTDQIRDEKAIEFICNIGEMQLTGADAETDYIIVDLDKPGTEPNTFKARKLKVAIEVASFDNNDGDMAATGNLLGIGDLVAGTFNTTTKEFAKGFIGKTLEFNYTATGAVSEISVNGITYDSVAHKFKNIPHDTISFTFKDVSTKKTATLTNTWNVA